MAATKNAGVVKNETKECITAALVALLKKDRLQNLTVSKVAQKAGVSRMAFYRNFDTLHQVLHEYYEPKISAVFQKIKNTSSGYENLRAHADFFNSFKEDITLSIKNGCEHILSDIFVKQIESLYKARDNVCQAAFVAAGTYAVWKNWLLDETKEPLEEVIRTLKTFHQAALSPEAVPEFAG